MKISWFGHASFLIETDKYKIITDPYEPGSYSGALGYLPIKEEAEIVTISHQHFDHNYIKDFKKARIISQIGVFSFGSLIIEGLFSYHDKQKGKERGENIIFIIKNDNFKIAHFGDLGSLEFDFEKLSDLTVALVPVGGTFTIGPKEAEDLLTKLKPKIFIPMHFKTEKIKFPILEVKEFLKDKDFEERNSLILDKNSLNFDRKIIVLKPQR